MPHRTQPRPRQFPGHRDPLSPSSCTVYDVIHLLALPSPSTFPRQSLLNTWPTLQEAQDSALQVLHTLQLSYIMQGWSIRDVVLIGFAHSGLILGLTPDGREVLLSEVKIVAREEMVLEDVNGETESQGFLETLSDGEGEGNPPAAGQEVGNGMASPSSAARQFSTNADSNTRNETASGSDVSQSPAVPDQNPNNAIPRPLSPIPTTAQDFFNPTDGRGDAQGVPRVLPPRVLLPRDENAAVGADDNAMQDSDVVRREGGNALYSRVKLPFSTVGSRVVRLDRPRASSGQEVGGEGGEEGHAGSRSKVQDRSRVSLGQEVGEEGGEEADKKYGGEGGEKGHDDGYTGRRHSWADPRVWSVASCGY